MKAKKLGVVLGLFLTASALFANEMYKENVVASYYADKFNGRRTASGEIFDMNGYTAAHKTLPFGTVLRVTNLENGKSVNVRVNDRGPFVQGREIDVSKAAAVQLDMVSNGTAKVSLEIVEESEGPVAGSSTAVAASDDDFNPYEDSSAASPSGLTFSSDSVSAPASGSAEPAPASNSVAASAPAANTPAPAKKETKTVTTTTTTTTTTVVQETSLKRWDIQLGAYTNEGNAKVMAHKLLQAGFDNVAYQKVGNMIRVVLRDIASDDLDTYQTKLDENGFSSYIVRERKNIVNKN